MGYKYTGDANLGMSLTVKTPKPLDSRSVVNNLQELYTIPSNTAYQGMTVANIDNGNIYMLIDKSKINEKSGWKASYESIQIITCTEAEYKIWQENTNEDFTPKDENQTYLHSDTYYYIYEDSLSPETYAQEYLTRSWGEQIEQTLGTKASSEAVINIIADLNNTNQNLSNNYYTKSEINETIETYATKALLETTFSETIKNYYTKSESDNIFVTKEYLKGGNEEEENNFIFVTQTQYYNDQLTLQEELNKTIKTNQQGELDTLNVNSITTSEINFENQIIQSSENGLIVNNELLAKQSEIPILITIPQEEYISKQESGELNPETYYYIYNTDENLSYVTNKYLSENYHTVSQYKSQIAQEYYKREDVDKKLNELNDIINTLIQRIDALENI